jgi:beta-galactosidase
MGAFFIDDLRDRADVFVDGKLKMILVRNVEIERSQRFRFKLGYNENARLDVLVENMGRINYGPYMADTKGASRIRLGGTQHFNWEIYTLPMNDLSGLEFKAIEKTPTEAEPITAPTFFAGELNVEGAPCDTWIRLDGFTKGFVVINGINIGRFWEIGPQKALYVPAPFLKEGTNEIIVYENEGAKALEVEFTDKPDLGM